MLKFRTKSSFTYGFKFLDRLEESLGTLYSGGLDELAFEIKARKNV